MSTAQPVPWNVLLRAFAFQGSWNYETLGGTGFAFVILPALRRVYRDPAALDAAVRRHEGPFNSHPYLATLALGAVVRMEEEGEDPAVIERFKAALRGSLGTLGDQLIWAGWRPACVLFALALLVAGAPWWAVVAVFLVVYNVGHVGLMAWGLRVGFRDGRNVAERLRGSLVRQTQPLLTAGAFLGGVVISLLVLRGMPRLLEAGVLQGSGWLWSGLAALAVAIGVRWGDRVRPVALAATLLLTVVGVALGVR